jgi:tetratricopeptide (TPR) repeat protein
MNVPTLLTVVRAAGISFAVALGLGTQLTAQVTPDVRISTEVRDALLMENEAAKLVQQGRFTDAEQLYKRSVSIIESKLPNDPVLAGSLNNLGNFYIGRNRFADAIPPLNRALAIFSAAFGDNNNQTATAINNLAKASMAEGKYDEAERLYLRGLAATEALLGPGHYGVAYSLDYLAQVKYAQRRYVEAERFLTKGMAVAEKALGPESPLLVTLMDHMISVLKAQGRETEAQALLARANVIASKIPKR